MINVFEYLEYRKCLADTAKSFKKRGGAWTLQRIAEKSGIQAPYLTNVLKGRAHFNGDQLFSISHVFNFSPDETNYLFLLLQMERSGLSERKKALKEVVDKKRKNKLKSEANIKKNVVDLGNPAFARYYSQPELKIIHFFLGIKRFAKQPHLIAPCLNISADKVDEAIATLIELGFIKSGTQGSVEVIQRNFHLPKDSPFCDPHQLIMHYRALQHQQLLDPEDKYNFSVTFTGNEETREKIQRRFMDFLKDAESIVGEAPEEDVYQLHFDLFKWSKDP